MKRISIGRAILVGIIWVNIPVIPIMMLPLFAVCLMLGDKAKEPLPPGDFPMVLLLIFIGFVLSWTWWAYMLPQWRLWSYKRVNDIENLKRQARRFKLAWPDGNILAKTEIQSQELQLQLKQFEESHHQD